MMNLDRRTLEMALIGYEQELLKIKSKVREIRKDLGQQPPPELDEALVRRTRRRMSPAAKRRIAAAQKLRWAAYRRKKAADRAKTSVTATRKRK